MQKIFSIILISLLLFSCSASKKEVAQKIAPKLLAKIIDIENSGLDEFLNFTVVCEVELSYEMRDEVEYTGAKLKKYANNIFNAVGTTKQIRRVAQLSFVNYIK